MEFFLSPLPHWQGVDYLLLITTCQNGQVFCTLLFGFFYCCKFWGLEIFVYLSIVHCKYLSVVK